VRWVTLEFSVVPTIIALSVGDNRGPTEAFFGGGAYFGGPAAHHPDEDQGGRTYTRLTLSPHIFDIFPWVALVSKDNPFIIQLFHTLM
jgi:hypothetical protein